MKRLEVWPAIDLLEGKPARLFQGAYDQVRSYAGTPGDLLDRLRGLGCPRLHLVDLSGAKSGRFGAWAVLSHAARLGLEVEVGGGFRDLNAIGQALAEGASQIVLGTALIASPGFADAVIQRFGGERIVVGLDVLEGKARIHGWTEPGPDALGLWQDLVQKGFSRVNVTDIQQDGSLRGVRQAFWQAWAGLPGNIGAGGGVRSLDDLDSLRRWGVDRAVVGKAWLEGVLDLSRVFGGGES